MGARAGQRELHEAPLFPYLEIFLTAAAISDFCRLERWGFCWLAFTEPSQSLQQSHLRIPWTEEPGGLQSMGLGRVRHD